MTTEVLLQGTVQEDGTLVLDNKPNLPPGRVEVVVRKMAPRDPVSSKENLVAFVQRVRRESEDRGHQFMTEEEISSWMEEMRMDDDRIERAYQKSDGIQGRPEQQ